MDGEVWEWRRSFFHWFLGSLLVLIWRAPLPVSLFTTHGMRDDLKITLARLVVVQSLRAFKNHATLPETLTACLYVEFQ